MQVGQFLASSNGYHQDQILMLRMKLFRILSITLVVVRILRRLMRFLNLVVGFEGTKHWELALIGLVRAGRPTQVVSFFDTMEKYYGFVRNLDSLKLVVGKLCDHGFASYAEKVVKSLANEFFPDEYVCDLLVKGWCVDKKLDEAKRLVREMNMGGFDVGAVAYNAMLDCVCKLCREKDPFRLQSEAENVLVEMDVAGVPRNVETFNVLISNLCKIRKTEDATSLFQRMGEDALFKEAESNGILAIPPNTYKVDPRFAKKPTATKKEKKRETLPEKMARKRRTLKKIRLSFVKKPKKTSARAY